MSGPATPAELNALPQQGAAGADVTPLKRRSATRGILIGLGISAILWVGIAYVVLSLLRG